MARLAQSVSRRAQGKSKQKVSAKEAGFAIWLLAQYFKENPEWVMHASTGDYTLLFPQGKLGSRVWKKWVAALKAARGAVI